MITDRQGEILNGVVMEYIERAMPVSSQLLEKKRKFGISPATVRNEMQKLTDEGYLFQPHTSAGRVPTDKGYRFFVDELLEELSPVEVRLPQDLWKSDFYREATKFLAEESSEFALGYLAGEKIVWKDGWGDIFEEPEFIQPGLAASFAKMIDELEENIEEIFLPEVKIYIGKENPVSESEDFSIITAGFSDGLFAILGPKRMSYDKNIKLLYNIWQKI